MTIGVHEKNRNWTCIPFSSQTDRHKHTDGHTDRHTKTE